MIRCSLSDDASAAIAPAPGESRVAEAAGVGVGVRLAAKELSRSAPSRLQIELVCARPAAARRDQILCDGFVLPPA